MNLARLEQLGYLGSHGFYDAIDYTAELSRPDGPRAPCTHGRPCKIVMAHHSGMTLLALSHALLGPTMPHAFCGTRTALRTISCCRSACRGTSVRSIRKRSIEAAITDLAKKRTTSNRAYMALDLLTSPTHAWRPPMESTPP